MNASRRIIGPLLALAVVLLASPLNAQSVYGQVSGRLVSASGVPVSGASVSVTSVQTGMPAGTKSDTSGYFNISNLGPDLYQIEVQAYGFKRVQSTIAVNVDSTTSVNATLQPGDPNTTQRSEAGASVLKMDRTDVSTLFDARSINELPLLDRNLTALQLLVPGAALGELFIPPNQNPQNGQPVNIDGQHFSGSAFQLDGTENRDPLEGIVVINPTLDSVGEMKVTTQGYNAEFGEATAGVVTIQTKSGSNAWHGDGFGFRRTDWGQSVDPFAPAGVPPSKYNIFGGSFGGPIAKNKLFIFGDYQGARSSQGADALLSVPPVDIVNNCGPTARAGVLCDLSEYSQFIKSNCPPNTGLTNCLTDSEGSPFPNYQIPNNASNGNPNPDHHVSSQAAALLALLPAPNHTSTTADPNCADPVVCDNYLASGKEVFHGDQFNIRTDYNAGSTLRVFGRYSFGEFYDNGTPAFGKDAGGLGINPAGFAGVARTRNQGISTGFTYTVGPKLLTDFRFGYFRYRLNVNAQDYGQTPTIGIPGISAADTHDPFATGLPDFEIPGQQTTTNGLFSGGTGDYLRFGYSAAANSCSCPLREREQQFQFVSNWIRSTGKHIVKWGADLRFLQNYRLASDRPPTGYFDFSPRVTGLGLATFLIGHVTSFDRHISSPAVVDAGERQKRFGFYGQDTWRVNSRLTLNYGLRWEIYFPQTVTGAGGFLVPNLHDHDPATTYFNTPSSSNTAGSIRGNLTNFAPRLGIAYLINPTTVVRVGYGRSFDAGYSGDIFGIAATENPPVTVFQKMIIQSVGFNLQDGPPRFVFPDSSFSLLDLASMNIGNPNLTPQIPGSGAVLFALPSRVRIPTVDSWNLTLQHELTSHLYFELAYVGNKGTHVFTIDNTFGAATSYDLNQPSLRNLIVPVQGGNISNCKGGMDSVFHGQFCLSVPAVRSFYHPVEVQPDPCLPQKTCYFDPTLFQVSYFGNNANDNYNSLQAKLNKNFSQGYSFLGHYTWSKGLDHDSNYFAVDPRIGYGPDDFDIRHRFVMTNILDLPIGRGKAWLGGIGPAANRLLGGWAISAITIWQSGLPFTPSYIRTVCAADTDTNAPCRPNRVGPVQVSGTREQYFSTTGGQALTGSNCVPSGKFCGVDSNGQPIPGPPIGPWQRPGAGRIGNVGRNSFTGPSFFQSDIGLAKVVPISERVALRFRADAINAFNKVNLGSPNPCVDCSGGGAITSLALGATQRRLQFSLRIEF
jgi:hypothetical protein